jgi:hypothetical protein
MADPAKIGSAWADDELDAIVADYFSMLNTELLGHSYVKTHHSAALMKQIGRTHRSVEFKHQNISAVLEELGMPWIPGYKPKRNYQNAIFGAIDRYLTAHDDALDQPVRSVDTDFAVDSVFVSPPVLAAWKDRPRQLEALVRKFDPATRDFRNRSLGRAGEQFVLEVERKRLTSSKKPELAAQVRWIAADEGDGAGYDILSFLPSGRELPIEVKTTNGAARTPFFLTRNEYETAAVHSDSWVLYRVYRFTQTPKIFMLAPPLDTRMHLRTENWRASFG